MAEGGTPQLEADSYDEDSQFGGNDAGSTTSSLNSSIYKYRYENGRSYHAYKDGKYWSPNDEIEGDRLDLQHHLFTLTFDGKLFTCPAGAERPIQRVLDVGTGTGIWAIDFADEHPEAHVIGIDLSPNQPSFVPPNLEFQIDDLEEDWTFSQKFDFIYSRMMTSSFADWPRFFDQCFAHLNPGGYIELADICFPIECDDDSFPENSALKKWTKTLLDATTQAGRPMDGAKQYKSQLEAAGFTNVVEKRYKWPQNRWPRDPVFKELGMWSFENIAPSLEGFSMALFTRVLGWSREEVETYLIDVRKELKDVRIHGYFPIYVVYGQKPSTD